MKHVDHSTKTQCVLWYHKLKSPTAVQRKFRNKFSFLRNSKLIWFNTNWFPWAAMKYYTHSINSLFINAWPAPSFAFHNAARFNIIFKPFLNAVSVRRVLSKLISKFTIRCTAVGDFNLWYQRTHCVFVEWSTCFILCYKLTPLLKMTYSCLF